MNQKKIGTFIATRRKEKGMTQVQFAEKYGVTNKAVSKWETGKCLPDAALFEDICSLLEITLNEFFAGEKILEKDIAARAEENLFGVVTEYQERNRQTTLHAILFGIGPGLMIKYCPAVFFHNQGQVIDTKAQLRKAGDTEFEILFYSRLKL